MNTVTVYAENDNMQYKQLNESYSDSIQEVEIQDTIDKEITTTEIQNEPERQTEQEIQKESETEPESWRMGSRSKFWMAWMGKE